MNDDGFAERLRAAEGPVTPDPRFADRLYLALATELKLPSAQGSVSAPARHRARPRLSLLAAAVLLVSLALVAAIVGVRLLERPMVVTVPSDWATFKGDAAHRGEGSDGPTGSPVLRWRFQANGAVPDNVSVVGQLAYASSDDGVLHALDVATGEERWSFVTDQPPLKGPFADEGVVYVFDGIGLLHALDALTGDERWTAAIPIMNPSTPTVGDGAVYAGSGDGALVAIDTADGAERWRTPISTTGTARVPALADGRVYVAADGGGFVAVDAADGTIDWRFDTGDLSLGSAVVADGVAFEGGTASDGRGVLWAIDSATGSERWRIEQPIFSPAVSGGFAYSGSDELGVFALDPSNGQVIWTFPVQGAARPLALADGVAYVAAGGEHRVYALDARTGSELWQFDLDAEVWCCIGVAQGAVYVGTQLGGVYAITGSGNPPAPKD